LSSKQWKIRGEVRATTVTNHETGVGIQTALEAVELTKRGGPVNVGEGAKGK